MIRVAQCDLCGPITVKHKLSGQSFPRFLYTSFSCCFCFSSLVSCRLQLHNPELDAVNSLCPVVPACICQLTPGRIQDEPAWLWTPRSVPSSSARCSANSQLHPVWLAAAAPLEMPFASGTGSVYRVLGSVSGWISFSLYNACNLISCSSLLRKCASLPATVAANQKGASHLSELCMRSCRIPTFILSPHILINTDSAVLCGFFPYLFCQKGKTCNFSSSSCLEPCSYCSCWIWLDSLHSLSCVRTATELAYTLFPTLLASLVHFEHWDTAYYSAKCL